MPRDHTIALYLKFRLPIKISLWLETVTAFFMVINIYDRDYFAAVTVAFFFTIIIAMATLVVVIIRQHQNVRPYEDATLQAIEIAKLEIRAFYRRQRLTVLVTGIPAVVASGIILVAVLSVVAHNNWSHRGTWIGLSLASLVALIISFGVIVLADLVMRPFFDAPLGLTTEDERILAEIERHS